MKRKGIIIVVILVIIVGIAFWWIRRNRFAIQWLNDGKLRITYKGSTTDVDPSNQTYSNTVDKSGSIKVTTVLLNKIYISVFGSDGQIVAGTVYDLTKKQFA